MVADATAQTTVYYHSFLGNQVPVGATLANLAIGSNEISMGLDAGVPHVASGSVYDIFAVSNGGTLVIGVGPAWTSTTARGTGAGTTQIDQANGGIWTNTVSLAHLWGGASGTTDYGPIAAGAGTYLGSLYATGNGQTGMSFKPAAAAGGTNNFLGLYNAYNQVQMLAWCRDSNNPWSTASTTWQVLDIGGTGSGLLNRITWLDGLGQSIVEATLTCTVTVNGQSNVNLGIDFDSTSATPAIPTFTQASATSIIIQQTAQDSLISLGLHFAQAMQKVTANTGTFFGSAEFLRVDFMN